MWACEIYAKCTKGVDARQFRYCEEVEKMTRYMANSQLGIPHLQHAHDATVNMYNQPASGTTSKPRIRPIIPTVTHNTRKTEYGITQLKYVASAEDDKPHVYRLDRHAGSERIVGRTQQIPPSRRGIGAYDRERCGTKRVAL